MSKSKTQKSGPAEAAPNDDEILGLDSAQGKDASQTDADDDGSTPGSDAGASSDAAEILKIFPTAADARLAKSRLDELALLDELFFARTPESHAELARRVKALHPEAFAELTKAFHTESGAPAMSSAAAINSPDAALGASFDAAPSPSAESMADPGKSAASPQHQPSADFYPAANSAVVNGVLETIRQQVDRLLPEEISPAAKNRVVGEIYRELDASLRANPDLNQQVRQAFQGGNHGDSHLRAVVGLVIGRAKQALPAITKRVVNEWTSSVLSAASERRARSDRAAKRVDISGGSPGSSPRRRVGSRDIDYKKYSDADILNM
ncbi:MAG: hypothetical protein ACRD50_16670 [Candidatus Acidiferrales bacterium]